LKQKTCLILKEEQVISQVEDFNQRFPDSKLVADANNYKAQSENNLKKIQNQNNEQTKATTQR
jgi:outer membrane protein assembly factor BamD